MIKDNIQDLIDPRKYQNSFKISNFKDDYYEHLFKKCIRNRIATLPSQDKRFKNLSQTTPYVLDTETIVI